MTALSPSRLSPRVSRRRAQPALASGLEPALAFLAAIWHVLSIFVLTPFPFLEHFPGWEIQSEAAPSGLAASREVCQPRSWQGENWTLPLPSPRGPPAPGSAWALLQRRREHEVSLPPHFPWGTQPGLLFFPVTWLFQSMAAAHQLRGTREKRIKGRLFFCLEEAC